MFTNLKWTESPPCTETPAAPVEQIACNLCGSQDYQLVYAATLSPEELLTPSSFQISFHRPRQHLQIVRCRICSLVQVNPRLRDAQSISHYQEMIDTGYLGERESRLAMGRRVMRKIGRWTPPGRLLDIGCAAGYLLQAAREDGWEVEGIEPSRWAMEYAQRSFGIRVHSGPLEAMDLPQESYDAIVMSDVIEHLSDPRRTLKEAHRLLKSSGVLYLTTPHFGCFWSRVMGDAWWGIIPAHNFFFTFRTLQDLLDHTGFRSLTMGTIGRTFTVAYWIHQGTSYAPSLGRWGKALAERLGLLHRPLRLNLGDQIETMASKLG